MRVLLSISMICGLAACQTSVSSRLPDANDSPSDETGPTPGLQASSALNDFDLTETALVLFNKNLSESSEIANYYVEKRGISTAHLCGVNAPVGDFMSLAQLKGVRNQILKNCVCPLLEESERPQPCDQTNIDLIAQATKIRSLVYIQGIPLRLYDTNWDNEHCMSAVPMPAEKEDPLVDYALSRALFDDGIFAEEFGIVPLAAEDFLPYYGADTWGSGEWIDGFRFPRNIQAFKDKRLAYGRIQGLSVARAKALIDRTLEAEASGFQGNIALGLRGKAVPNIDLTPTEPFLEIADNLYFFQDLFGGRKAECEDYLTEPESYWDPSVCKVGANPLGHIPAETGGKIIQAENVGLFLGGEYQGNGQRPFDGKMETLSKWRKTSEVCTPLCSQFATELERTECKSNSKDYFKEINTDCVGGALGLMGWQYRSWTATTYALNPLGWEGTISGDEERTGVRILDVGGFENDRFTDTKFVRWGHSGNSATCIDEVGNLSSCFERIAIRFTQMGSLDQSLALNQPLYFRLKFRYRNSGLKTSGFNPKLKATLKLWGGSQWTLPIQDLALSEPHTEWSEAVFNFVTNPASAPPALSSVNKIQLWFHATHAEQMEGYFDMDAVELQRLDADGNLIADLMSSDVGSFSSETTQDLPYGEWPATIIERLGGIGYWGSANHHITCGNAFADSNKLIRTFFAGRSLGESLMLNSAYTMASGLIFADPLYRPSGAFIYLTNYVGSGINRDSAVKIKPSSANLLSMPLKVNAFHGTDKLAETKFKIEFCNSFDDDCAFTTLLEQTGAAYGQELNLKFGQFLPSELVSIPVQIRLKVWNPGEEDRALYSRAYFKIQEGEDPTDGVASPDMNNDGKVDTIDLSMFLAYWGTDYQDADFNSDGIVDAFDYAILLAAWTG